MNSRRRNAIPFTARPATISETPHYTTISPSSPPTRRTTLSYLTPLYDYVEPEPYQQRDVSTRRSSASSHASDLPRTPSSGQYSPITTRQRSSGSDLGFSLSEAEVNPVIAFRQLLEVHRARVHKSERQPLGTPSLSARSASVNTSLAGRRPFTRVHRVLPSSMTDVTSTFEVGANRNTVGRTRRTSETRGVDSDCFEEEDSEDEQEPLTLSTGTWRKLKTRFEGGGLKESNRLKQELVAMQEDIYRCEEELRSREASLKIREEAVNRKEDELRQAQRTLDIKTSKIRDGMEDSMENDEAQWTIDDIHRKLVVARNGCSTPILRQRLFSILQGLCATYDRVPTGMFVEVECDKAVALKLLRIYQITDAAGRAKLKRASVRICDYIKQCQDRGDVFEPSQINSWISQIILGLASLHHEGIIHGDLRAANILLDPDLHVRVADFGLAQLSDDIGTQATTLERTPNWLAPELLDPTKFGMTSCKPTKAGDVFAFGCVCVELYTGQPPFAGLPLFQVITHVTNGDRPEKPLCYGRQAMSDSLWQLVLCCISTDSINRPTAADAAASLNVTLSQAES
ncbi:unnamed protein product [Somion occarium]|uniref:Protein kinase domain-containing protein n=1 Tax=Somion occarium TaxID=3059160 RepID=A0ABP1DZU7_9APHY